MTGRTTKEQRHARRVEVHWIDSHSDENRWERHEDAKKYARDKPAWVVSVGFVIADKKSHITLCGHITCHYKASLWTIPKCAIKKLIELGGK